MEPEETQIINANQMLLETAVNLFSDKTQEVKTLLKSSKEIFSKDFLDQSLMSCCRHGNILLMPDIITAGADLDAIEENGNTPLLMCAFNSHESCAKFLLGAGAKVNAVNSDGNTPLIVSVRSGSSIGVTKLLVGIKDIRIDHANKNGYTALLCAIEAANLNAIKLLIDAGASTDKNVVVRETLLNLEDIASKKGLLNLINLFKLQKCTGKSPLLLASLNRDLESVQIMSSLDDSILNTQKNSFASTMVEFLKSIQENKIVTQSEMEIFKFLLKHVATLSLSSHVKESIMDVAISIGDHTIVGLLSQFDFVISHQNLSSAVFNPSYLGLLLKNRHVINKLDSNDQPVYSGSPLDVAMQGEEIDSVKALILHGAFMDIDDALQFAVKSNHEKAVQFLLTEFPAELREKIKSSDILHNAIIFSAISIIKILLDLGADVNSVCQGKYTLTQAVDVNVLDLLLSRGADPNMKIRSTLHTHPLHHFVSSDYKYTLKKWLSLQSSDVSEPHINSKIEDFVKCLLRHGAKIDLKDGLGRTALHIAAKRYNSVGILNVLIAFGAKVNETDAGGETPLYAAVEKEDVESIKCLIHAGADIDRVCEYSGESAIFRARNETILKLLLDSGADADVTDFEGNTPLQSFIQKGRTELACVKRLIGAGTDIDHENDDGYTALILAARYVNMDLLTLIVEEGADVNLSTGAPLFVTAFTAMLIKLWHHAECASPCIHYLIDQKARIDNVHSCVIHVLIASGCLSLIPKIISSGLAPSYLTIEKSSYAWFTSTTHISPLVMALLLKQSDLAQYFIDIKYLMKSDITILSGNKVVQKHLKSKRIVKSLDLLKTFSRQPMALETLCSVVLSDTLGQTQDRRSRVQKLGLPQPLQDLLLFKNVTENSLKDVNKRNLFLFKQALHQSKLYQLDTDDEDESNSDFYSDDDEF